MGRISVGTQLSNFGNTETIGQYISTKPPPKEPTRNSHRAAKKTAIPIKTRTLLRSKISLEELRPLLSKTSRKSSVAPEPRNHRDLHKRKQVCFLENPNFKPKKSVKFLLLPSPKENRPPLYLLHQERIPPVVFQDPHKPPRYPPQISPRHNHH